MTHKREIKNDRQLFLESLALNDENTSRRKPVSSNRSAIDKKHLIGQLIMINTSETCRGCAANYPSKHQCHIFEPGQPGC